jgi:predicted nucleic acid-binding protein
MNYLLDTGPLISTLRGDDRADRLLTRLSEEGSVLVSSMTVLEVLRGCRNDREENAAAGILLKPDVVDMDYAVAEGAAKLLRGWPGVFSTDKAVPDAIIAASAIATSSTLVTLNTRQFSRLNVPGLRLLLIDQQAPDWATQVR